MATGFGNGNRLWKWQRNDRGDSDAIHGFDFVCILKMHFRTVFALRIKSNTKLRFPSESATCE